MWTMYGSAGGVRCLALAGGQPLIDDELGGDTLPSHYTVTVIFTAWSDVLPVSESQCIQTVCSEWYLAPIPLPNNSLDSAQCRRRWLVWCVPPVFTAYLLCKYGGIGESAWCAHSGAQLGELPLYIGCITFFYKHNVSVRFVIQQFYTLLCFSDFRLLWVCRHTNLICAHQNFLSNTPKLIGVARHVH